MNTARKLSSPWKITFLSSVGGMLEFYDFVIFAIFALPIGQAFFPHKTALISVMSAFAAFAVGYLARPLGGLVFSHFGDRHGRKRAFILSVFIMGGATLLMGLLPTYQDEGILMSILFVFLRIVQGMAVGGEIPGAMVFVMEHLKRYSGTACGVVFLFINLGTFLANAVYAVMGMLLKNTGFQEDSWRVAFILGGFLAVGSYFLRMKMNESPVYLKHKAHAARIPFVQLMKSYSRNVLAGICLVAVQATLVSLLYLYVTQYLSLLGHYTHRDISVVTLTALSVFSICCAFWGWMADKLGCKPILCIGMLLLMAGSYWYYYAMIHHVHVLLAAIAVSVVAGMVTGSFGALLITWFPIVVRYSGMAICYNVAFAVFGGLSPLLATYLIHQSHNLLFPAYLLMMSAVIGLLGVLIAQPVKSV